MSDEMYLFLSSESFGFTANSPAKFTTVFNTPIELPNDVENYEVGVSKLIVSSHALNVVDGEFHFHSISLGSTIATRVPTGQYSIPDGLTTAFITAIHPDSNDYILSYDLPVRKFRLQTRSNQCMISLSKNLQKLMGFPPVISGAGITYANQSWDSTGGFEDLYVHCDNVELSYLGNEKQPVMAVFPYMGSYSAPDQIFYEPANIAYIPLLRKSFQSLEIEIKNAKGEFVSFPPGSQTVIVLHIRIGRL